MIRRSEAVTFGGGAGEQLAGRLDRPIGEPLAYAVFSHCFTCTKDLKSIHWIGRALAERGVAVLRFDFTGLGESRGDFSQTNLTSNVADVLAAVDFLRKEYRAPQLLIGHSLGGAAMLLAARDIPEVQCVATVSAPSTTQSLRQTLLRMNPRIESEGEGEIELGGQRFMVRRQLLDDLASYNLASVVAALPCASIVFHSPDDETLDAEHGLRNFQAAPQPKSHVALPGADHLVTRDRRDARYIAEVLAAWCRRYLTS